MGKHTEHSIFDYSIKTSRTGDTAEIELMLFFNKRPVNSTRFVGCSGGTVSFSSDHIEVKDFTPSRTIAVSYETASEAGTSVGVAPAVTLTEPTGASAEVSLVTVTSSKKDSEKASFQGKEAPLQATLLPENRGVIWSISMPRGKKVVKDFLETNEPLAATGDCTLKRIMVRFEAYATGRVLTDSRFAELNGLQTLGLWIRMLHRGGLPELPRIWPRWRWV